MKITMVEAARRVLTELGRPATAREIHAEIVQRELFQFGAKDPVSVLGSALRRRTKGSAKLSGPAMFETPHKGLYELA
jgi:restriction system protein